MLVVNIRKPPLPVALSMCHLKECTIIADQRCELLSQFAKKRLAGETKSESGGIPAKLFGMPYIKELPDREDHPNIASASRAEYSAEIGQKAPATVIAISIHASTASIGYDACWLAPRRKGPGPELSACSPSDVALDARSK